MLETAKRSDAVRNRRRVLAAAEAVFAERGVEAGVPEVAERAGGDRAITAALASGVALEQLAAARSSVWAAVDALLDRAKAEGRIAPDARAADLRVLWAGVARVLAADGNADATAWRRYAGLVLRALA